MNSTIAEAYSKIFECSVEALPQNSKMIFDPSSISCVFFPSTTSVKVLSLRERMWNSAGQAKLVSVGMKLAQRRSQDAGPIIESTFNAKMGAALLRTKFCYLERLGLETGVEASATASFKAVSQEPREVLKVKFHHKRPNLLIALLAGNVLEIYDTLRDLDLPFFFRKLETTEQIVDFALIENAGEDYCLADDFCVLLATASGSVLSFGPFLIHELKLTDRLFEDLEELEITRGKEDFSNIERLSWIKDQLRSNRPLLNRGVESGISSFNIAAKSRTIRYSKLKVEGTLQFFYARSLDRLGNLLISGHTLPSKDSSGSGKVFLRFWLVCESALLPPETEPLLLAEIEIPVLSNFVPKIVFHGPDPGAVFVLVGFSLTRVSLDFLDVLQTGAIDLRQKVDQRLRASTLTIKMPGFSASDFAPFSEGSAIVFGLAEERKGSSPQSALLMLDFDRATPFELHEAPGPRAIGLKEVISANRTNFESFDQQAWDKKVEAWDKSCKLVTDLAIRANTSSPDSVTKELREAYEAAETQRLGLIEEMKRISTFQSAQFESQKLTAERLTSVNERLITEEAKIKAKLDDLSQNDKALKATMEETVNKTVLLDGPSQPDLIKLTKQLEAIQKKLNANEYTEELDRFREIKRKIQDLNLQIQKQEKTEFLGEEKDLQQKALDCIQKIKKIENKVNSIITERNEGNI